MPAQGEGNGTSWRNLPLLPSKTPLSIETPWRIKHHTNCPSLPARKSLCFFSSISCMCWSQWLRCCTRFRRVVVSAAASGLLSGCLAACRRYQPPKFQDFPQMLFQNGEHVQSQQAQSICLYHLYHEMITIWTCGNNMKQQHHTDIYFFWPGRSIRPWEANAAPQSNSLRPWEATDRLESWWDAATL